MSAWPQLSAPIFAGDNFSIAKALSAATVNRPAATPIYGGGSYLGLNVVNRGDGQNNEARRPASTFPKGSPVHNPTPSGRAALSNFKDSK